jgi:hypothetical protein
MDESLLPPAEAPRRPFPWRTLALAFIPAAALAAGTGLLRVADSQQGDTLLRWISWSSAAGVLLGALCGALLRRRWAWTLYGMAAPWVVAGLVSGAISAARPIREWISDRREAGCRGSGRPLCTVPEFAAACAAHDRARLGPPSQSLCAAKTCTQRWTYDGPFPADDLTSRPSLICSIVTDSAGRSLRSSVTTVATTP